MSEWTEYYAREATSVGAHSAVFAVGHMFTTYAVRVTLFGVVCRATAPCVF